MAENEKKCYYNLEDRTFDFSKATIRFLRSLPKDFIDFELAKQLVRSACSVGANYIEANESLSLKDFIMRSKISKKEAKESIYWLSLIECSNDFEIKRDILIKE
jgi:four helix bundle protein